MNKITINHGTFQVDEKILDHGEITLGRTADNDVRMEDDTVSAHHAKIVTVFTASHVEDLGSTNGTFVNGRRVIKHTLHSGDIITAGGYQVVFYSDHGAPKKAPEKTVMMSSARLEAMIAASDKNKGLDTRADSGQSVPVQSGVDTVIAIDNDETHQQIYQDSVARATPHSNKQGRQNRPAELADIKNTLQAREGHDNSKRSLYVTVAATIFIVIAIVVLVIKA
jgi:pSer/pThr/pTyr-binding forkhead associated (FHA) protein